MADPIKVLQLLGGAPVSAYTVFEPDQVLTHGQLNDLARYLNQQQRLTRTQLVGVGLVSGLELTVGDSAVTVSPGVGITTDGDLVVQPGALSFTHGKPYDATQPRYDPFFPGDAAMFELVELTDGNDPQGTALGTGLGGRDSAVVLLVETAEHDPDLCLGEGCDNLGRRATTRLRLLLARAQDAKALQAGFRPVSERARGLPDLMATRPQLDTLVADTQAFRDAYRKACERMLQDLDGAFGRLAADFQAELAALFPGRQDKDWTGKLKEALKNIGVANAQLTYGFFKDLVDTWNDLVDALLDTTAILLPEGSAFPKHLVLGCLNDPAALRTAFYPSMADSGAREAAARASFLMRKLDDQVRLFATPTDTTLRVTPSMGEEVPLEERAIPWYYGAGMARRWSFRLSRRQQTDTALGYRAAQYGGTARALDPLSGSIAGFEMFRVEGHLGRDVQAVRAELKALVARRNLPFKVHAVLAHTKRAAIRVRPGIRFTDLHRLHHLIRQDVAVRLDEGRSFATKFADNIRTAVQAKTIPDQLGDMVSATQAAQAAQADFQAFSTGARASLGAPRYSAYRQAVADHDWTQQLGEKLQNLGHVRAQVGEAARNDLVSPLDSLIQTTHPVWLDWLDKLIVHRDQQADDKLLLASFLGEHPQLDHLGGTWRGGTFVLLYDDQGLVVGDFALPYPFEEADEPEPELPVLTPPVKVRPPIGVQPPIGIVRPIRLDLDDLVDARVLDKIGVTGKALDEKMVKFNEKLDSQLKFTTSNVESLVKGAFSVRQATAAGVVGARAVATGDAVLDELARDVDYKRQRVQELAEMNSRADLNAQQRSAAQKLLDSAQGDLAAAVGATAEHVVATNADTAAGAAAGVAGILAQGTILVTGTTASTTLTNKLGTLVGSAGSTNLKSFIGGLNNIANMRR